jgi:hypothetical protein
MLLDCLFGPWGSFDYAKAMVRYVNEDDTSIAIPQIQGWGCIFMSPSNLMFPYMPIEDFNYILSMSLGIPKFDGRLNSMWLFLNIGKW